MSYHLQEIEKCVRDSVVWIPLVMHVHTVIRTLREQLCAHSRARFTLKTPENLLKFFTQEYGTSGLDPTLKRHLDPTGKYVQISLQIHVSLHWWFVQVMPSCSRTFWTETRLHSTSIERYIVHVDTIGLSMLISVELFEQTKPSKYVLFICVNTWMALFFFATIAGIINTVISERWPLSTNLWHFVLLFQCKNAPPRPTLLRYLAVGGKPGDEARMCPIDFRVKGQGHSALISGFLRITAFPLNPWSQNFTGTLLLSQGCALLISGSKGQRSRSQCINYWKWLLAHNFYPFIPMVTPKPFLVLGDFDILKNCSYRGYLSR